MPFARLSNLKEEKRTRIMETALEAFLEQNFQTASINQISKKAGLSAGALYYYFEDKEDLFNTTLEYVTLSLMEQIGNIESIFEERGYWEGIDFLVYQRLIYTNEHPKHMKLFHRVLNSNDPVEMHGKAALMRPFKKIFSYGYDNGYIRDDIPKELLFGIHFSMILSINKWSLETQFENHYESIDLKKVSSKSIEMIQSAVGKE